MASPEIVVSTGPPPSSPPQKMEDPPIVENELEMFGPSVPPPKKSFKRKYDILFVFGLTCQVSKTAS
jgi:hypothetical protein